MSYTLTMASLAGLVVRRGGVTAMRGTDHDFQRVVGVRAILVAGTAILFVILMNYIVPLEQRFGVFVAAELVIVGLFLAILPSRRFHRARGVLPNLREWKKRLGVKEVWMLYALIHDPELPEDELESAVNSLMPDLGAGTAAIVCTTAESQVRVLERLGLVRDSPDSGLLFRKSGQARSAADDGLAAEPV
ncbi:hypothetical protein [Paenarthrobacter sp. NPDC058040]|uniref:hypothetical protein n=2 Tax=unclassified Paenarthrobacter TaxID=2634190 RepID=UPI0036DBA34D